MKNLKTKSATISKEEYLLNRLYEYTSGAETINIKGISTVMGVDAKTVTSLMKDYPYLAGRSHRYFVIDVVNAFCSIPVRNDDIYDNNSMMIQRIKVA
jgi:hypothetical protein